MSDSNSTYGEPVEEPRPEGDVVDSANEGIAEAEAARREAAYRAAQDSDAERADHAERAEHDSDSAAVDDPRTPVEPARSAYDDDSSFDSALYEAHADPNAPQWEAPAASAAAVTSSEPTRADERAAYSDPAAYREPEVYREPAVSNEPAAGAATAAQPPVETVVVAPAAGYAGPQPIFVQAPEAPRLRGNRGAAAAIGLLAALVFGVLYLAVWLVVGMLDGAVTLQNVGTSALDALRTWTLWVPIVVFYIGFWLLGAIINRGRWGAWVIFGLLVGVAAYLGHILGALFQAPFWMLTAREGAALVEGELLAPLAIAAFIIGRELTIWFGAWVAARGARVTELNLEAQREYERTLEAGPQLTRV